MFWNDLFACNSSAVIFRWKNYVRNFRSDVQKETVNVEYHQEPHNVLVSMNKINFIVLTLLI